MNERVSSLPTRYYFWTGFIIIVIIIYILLMTIYVKPVTIDTNDVIDANKIKNENENEITIITTREEQSPKEKEKEKALVLQTYPELNSAALFFSGRVSCFHDSYLFLRTNFLDRFSTCHLYFSLNLDEKDPETRNHLQDIYETYDHDKLTPEQIQQYIDEDLHVELISEPQKRLGHIQRIQVSVYSPPEEWTRWIPLNREELLLKNSTHQLRVGSMYFNNWRAGAPGCRARRTRRPRGRARIPGGAGGSRRCGAATPRRTPARRTSDAPPAPRARSRTGRARALPAPEAASSGRPTRQRLFDRCSPARHRSDVGEHAVPPVLAALIAGLAPPAPVVGPDVGADATGDGKHLRRQGRPLVAPEVVERAHLVSRP
jgi:hypothetical protein